MHSKTIRVLAIEDNPADAFLFEEMLAEATAEGWALPQFQVVHAARLSDGLALLAHSETGIDVILTDLKLPDSAAEETFYRLQADAPRIPIVVLTGQHDIALARQMVRDGAEDYLFKRQLNGSLLARALIYAIERKLARLALEQAHDALEAHVVERTQALQESEAHYRTWFEGIPIGLYRTAPDGKILDVNPTLVKMLGFDNRETLLAMNAGKGYATPDDRARWQAQIDRDDIACDFETRWRRQDGTVIWVKECARAIRDNNGEVIAYEGAAEDITERKQAQTRLQQTLEAATEGIWYWHFPSDRLTFSPRYYTMLGYEPGAFPAAFESWLNLIHPDDRPAALSVVEEYLHAKPDVYENEFRMRTQNGDYRWIHAKASVVERQPDGTAVLMIGNHEDITDRKQAEDALRRSEECFRMTVHRSPIGIGIVDSQGNLTDCNATLADIVGYTREELLKMNFADFTHPEDLAREWELIDRIWADQQPEYRMEKRYLHRDGRVVWVDVAASLFKQKEGDQGEPAALAFGFAFVQDITARKEMEAALRASEQQVQRKLNSLLAPEGDFSALELNDVLDVPALQALMDEFYALTHIGIGIIDLEGRVLVATGWQDICTQFHRVHPETCRNCVESDTLLSQGVAPGEFKAYKCKNMLWDIVTPLFVGERHIGNLFLGQFFYADEQPDYERFRAQARRYGFTEEAYLAALDRVPRWSRERVETVMRFYAQFAQQHATLSYGNLKLARALAERDALLKSLHESEERLRLAHKATNDVVWDWDIVHDTQQWNEAGAEVFGWTDIVEAPQTANWWIDRVYPDDRQRVEEGFFAVVNDPEQIHWRDEYRFRKADGGYAQVMDRGYVLRDTQGKALRMIGAMLDITARQQAEDALRASEAKYRTLYEGAAMGIFHSTFEGRFLDVNLALARMLGYTSPQEVVASITNIAEQLYASPPRRDEVIAQLLARGETITVENRYLRKDGAEWDAYLHIRYVLDEEGAPMYLEGFVEDITERRRAEKALRESEQQKNLILNAMNEMVSYYTPDLRVIWANRASAESVDMPPEALVGRPCYEIWNRRSTPCDGCPVLKARATKKPVQAEQQTPDGRYWLLRGYPVLDAAGNVTALVEFGQDITERREAQRKIESYAADLERSNRELEQFAYIISHDLQEPARTVLSYLHLLEQSDHVGCSEKATMFIQYAVDGAQRMQAMIRALLDLSRVGTRGQPFTTANCEQVLAMTCRALQHAIQQSDARITHDPLPNVQADANQLGQVFQNLVANAIKFHRADAPPRIHISANWNQAAEHSNAQTNGMWEFSVQDNGIGIPPDQAGRLFKTFQRLHTQEEYPGVGIGLALCKRIIERHGGAIWIEAGMEQGATIKFTLPDRTVE